MKKLMLVVLLLAAGCHSNMKAEREVFRKWIDQGNKLAQGWAACERRLDFSRLGRAQDAAFAASRAAWDEVKALDKASSDAASKGEREFIRALEANERARQNAKLVTARYDATGKALVAAIDQCQAETKMIEEEIEVLASELVAACARCATKERCEFNHLKHNWTLAYEQRPFGKLVRREYREADLKFGCE